MKQMTDFVFQSAASAAGEGNAITNAQGNLYVAVSGTFVGKLKVQGKQGETWFDVNVIDLKSLENVTEIEAPGAYAVCAPEAFEAVRCNLTTYTSGSVTVTGRLCQE